MMPASPTMASTMSRLCNEPPANAAWASTNSFTATSDDCHVADQTRPNEPSPMTSLSTISAGSMSTSACASRRCLAFIAARYASPNSTSNWLCVSPVSVARLMPSRRLLSRGFRAGQHRRMSAAASATSRAAAPSHRPISDASTTKARPASTSSRGFGFAAAWEPAPRAATTAAPAVATPRSAWPPWDW